MTGWIVGEDGAIRQVSVQITDNPRIVSAQRTSAGAWCQLLVVGEDFFVSVEDVIPQAIARTKATLEKYARYLEELQAGKVHVGG